MVRRALVLLRVRDRAVSLLLRRRVRHLPAARRHRRRRRARFLVLRRLCGTWRQVLG